MFFYCYFSWNSYFVINCHILLIWSENLGCIRKKCKNNGFFKIVGNPRCLYFLCKFFLIIRSSPGTSSLRSKSILCPNSNQKVIKLSIFSALFQFFFEYIWVGHRWSNQYNLWSIFVFDQKRQQFWKQTKLLVKNSKSLAHSEGLNSIFYNIFGQVENMQILNEIFNESDQFIEKPFITMGQFFINAQNTSGIWYSWLFWKLLL
jgi:hypothetical protein